MHNLLMHFFHTTPFLPWIGICIIAIIIEEIYRSGKRPAFRGRFLNMGSGFVACLSILVVTPLASIFVYSVGNRFGLGLIDLRFFLHLDLASQIGSAVILMFVEDFFFYFFHRAAHTIPVLWDIHAVHHSETEMNVTSTVRRHWLETPLQEICITIPMMLLFRLTPLEMGIVAFGRSAFVFTSHMDIKLQLGRYSWLLTSPQLHRLHHSALRKHWDSNYTQVFPIFDKIFGTYVAPERNEFPPTGISLTERIDTVSDVMFWPFKKWAERLRKIKAPALVSDAASSATL